MKLGITNDVYYYTPDKKTDYAKMRADGFDACDFQGMSHPQGALQTMPEAELEKVLTAERIAAAACGISISQVHCCEPRYDAESPCGVSNIESIKRCIRATALLGSKYLAVHPVMPNGWGPEPDGELAIGTNRKFFTTLCEYAKDYGVYICLENMPFPEHFISQIPDVANFVESLNFDNLCICLDTGHANMFSDHCGEMALRCGKLLKILHVHDNRKHSDDHSLPYQGNVDWKGFMSALKEIGFDGVLSLEPSFNQEATAEIRDLFQQFAAKIAASLLN